MPDEIEPVKLILLRYANVIFFFCKTIRKCDGHDVYGFGTDFVTCVALGVFVCAKRVILLFLKKKIGWNLLGNSSRAHFAFYSTKSRWVLTVCRGTVINDNRFHPFLFFFFLFNVKRNIIHLLPEFEYNFYTHFCLLFRCCCCCGFRSFTLRCRNDDRRQRIFHLFLSRSENFCRNEIFIQKMNYDGLCRCDSQTSTNINFTKVISKWHWFWIWPNGK